MPHFTVALLALTVSGIALSTWLIPGIYKPRVCAAVTARCVLTYTSLCLSDVLAIVAVRGDLVRILHKLLKRSAKFDYIIIETTGLADPAPVAQTFFVDEGLQQHLELDAIVTIVDAKHIHQHLDEKKPEGVENEVNFVYLSPAPTILQLGWYSTLTLCLAVCGAACVCRCGGDQQD